MRGNFVKNKIKRQMIPLKQNLSVDEVKFERKFWNDDYIDRDYQNANFSKINFGQEESIGPDSDNVGIPDSMDNCPNLYNSDQEDTDLDGIGNLCDNCPYISNSDQTDSDNDNVGNACDFVKDGNLTELTERIEILEQKVEELENKTSFLESLIQKIINFIKKLPQGLSRGWVD